MLVGEIISELINAIPLPIMTGKRNKGSVIEFSVYSVHSSNATPVFHKLYENANIGIFVLTA